ncbi:DNA mismatch repair protein MutT [Curtobacterium sp. MCJR17_055]|uniref:NUDIX domain-containing protein n=2 Tax=Curtobacterium TaxID=2034 RepID=UPI000D97C04A|nr:MULTISPECIES: NUDIX domain-containing protein [unclassified Curtobacterium]PYY35022.1 DNA mismatch repair protein MutT [Curtobacterium sp. MCBD17_029]PYY42445.1 DNA mismatch repair protein MutT [Curtobacterium sp. MCPF17_046]PYY55698.1 DNA mismatch repair protein MutT [Curtobacterium sp. MCJR17_055]PYY60443.1 DNA mismatch repair protein MutT [Curtobacterium sp. MCPF17_015]WIB14107.1 NUDIX domain-containing protein [Curtobacterium sp. MCPF17_050]
MPLRSAGLLLHRGSGPALEVFIAHMGGPFWRRRPRAWTIPKGEPVAGEDTLTTALREFTEEIGTAPPDGVPHLLGDFRQASGKVVTVHTLHAPDFSVDVVRSNTVALELPRGSGRFVEVPEVDDARWTPVDSARGLVVAGQVAALDALAART